MAPVLILYAVLLVSRHSYPLTPLSYRLVAVLLILIAIGAHYGFDAVPAFEWLRAETGGVRNNFDRFAHFFQGLVPAAVFREVLLRARIAPTAGWLAALTLAMTLALSALYELVEWSAALLLGDRAASFVAAQGDPWDAQTDMALALAGAATMLGLFSRTQNRQLAELKSIGAIKHSATSR